MRRDFKVDTLNNSRKLEYSCLGTQSLKLYDAKSYIYFELTQDTENPWLNRDVRPYHHIQGYNIYCDNIYYIIYETKNEESLISK